jgi:CubicO group peptidase (beta-lactamase class C family)
MKLFKRTFLFVLVVGMALIVTYVWRALPILSGYGAKDLCSCVFVANRDENDVIKNELGRFPLTLGSFSTDLKDSSASGSVLGLGKKKAIYRKGLGCTLIAEIKEEELRAQHPTIALPVGIDADTIAWPSGDKVSGVVPATVNFQKLNQTLENAFNETGEKKLRRVRAVVVVYDGQIIAEKYAPGFSAKSKHHGWSMTKSITNALVGILVKEGKLAVDDPAPVAEWKEDQRNQITLNNLLQATSGLKWKENYAGPSEATNMLFKKKDMGTYTAKRALDTEPGKTFKYSSGTPNLISRIIREKTGSEYYKFPYDSLFHKIGMYSAVIEPDAGGTFVGSSYSFATARDWARFGLLYLNDGVWNGKRILPEGWVKYTTTPAVSAPIGEYGALFWLNAGALNNPSHRRYPDASPDVYGADGYEGQNVWIVPSKKLVIVRLSLEQGNYLDENSFLAEIIEAMP